MGKHKKKQKGVTYRSLEDAADALQHSDDAKSRTQQFAAKERAQEAKFWQEWKAGHLPALDDLSDDDDQQWRDEAAFINQTRADQKAASAAAEQRAQKERQEAQQVLQNKINTLSTKAFLEPLLISHEEQRARQEIANQRVATLPAQKTPVKSAAPHSFFQAPQSREARRAAETKRRLAEFEKRREQTLFKANTTQQQHVDPNQGLPAQDIQKNDGQQSNDARAWFNPTRMLW